jgi:N-formylmaleamate deformylase
MFNQPSQQDTAFVQAYRPLETFIPKNWESGFVTAADGTALHYTRTGGDKPVLILLHGVQVNGLSWLRTAQAFEKQFDVMMPDFRGHGESGRIGAAVITNETLVDDTRTIIRELKLENPFVIGHSMGADIAGRLAAVESVRGVVLVDPALRNFASAMIPSDGTIPPWMQSLYDTLNALKTLPHAEKMAAGLRLIMPGAPMMDEEDYVAFIEGQAQFDLAFFRDVQAMGYLVEEPAVIAQISAPALLMTARPMMPGDIQPGIDAFMTHFQNGQHVHFPDSGHAIYAEQFERFIAVLRAFFAGK